MEKSKTKDLVLMAFYVALFIVFDLIVNAIPFLQMPNGGSYFLLIEEVEKTEDDGTDKIRSY